MSTIEIQTQLNSSYYFSVISFTLLFYDYFLTLEWEVTRYWGSPFTWPNALFFVNRYATLFGNIPVVVQYFWTTESTPTKIMMCRHLVSYHQYFVVVTQIIVGVMLILRTYALYERNTRILGLMVVVSAGVIGVGVWSVVGGSGTKIPDAAMLHLYIGCSSPVSHSESIGLAAAWAGMGVFDCMIFLLTLYRALSRRRGAGLDLLAVLLRDGSIYFGVMVMSNLSNILTFVLGGLYSRGVVTTFTNIISSLTISRLMLNLRDPALASLSGRRAAPTGTGTPTAASGGPGLFSSYLGPGVRSASAFAAGANSALGACSACQRQRVCVLPADFASLLSACADSEIELVDRPRLRMYR